MNTWFYVRKVFRGRKTPPKWCIDVWHKNDRGQTRFLHIVIMLKSGFIRIWILHPVYTVNDAWPSSSCEVSSFHFRLGRKTDATGHVKVHESDRLVWVSIALRRCPNYNYKPFHDIYLQYTFAIVSLLDCWQFRWPWSLIFCLYCLSPW